MGFGVARSGVGVIIVVVYVISQNRGGPFDDLNRAAEDGFGAGGDVPQA